MNEKPEICLSIRTKDFFAIARAYGIPIYYILIVNNIHNMRAFEPRVISFQLEESIQDERIFFAIQKILSWIFEGEIVTQDELPDLCRTQKLCYYPYDEKRIDLYTLFLAFAEIMADTYGEKHYVRNIKAFYQIYGIETSGSMPVDIHLSKAELTLPQKKTRRAVYRNMDWESLYEVCTLCREFVDGKRRLTQRELLLLARNFCGAEKGKNQFLQLLNSPENAGYSYTQRNWRAILNGIIKGNVPPQKCQDCPHEEECCHGETMLATVKPGRHDVRVLERQSYVSLQEAESDFAEKFQQAIAAEDDGMHLILAQTGLGKTRTYLEYLKHAEKPCLIAVPTHQLMQEVAQKAVEMGITDLCCTPILPWNLSEGILNKVDHLYRIGAGSEVLKFLSKCAENLPETDADAVLIRNYLQELKQANRFQGHMITTHARLLVMSEAVLQSHQIIIDEDILRQVFCTGSVPISDVRNVLHQHIFSNAAKQKLGLITHKNGYFQFPEKTPGENLVSDMQMQKLQEIQSNLFGMLRAETLYADAEKVLFLERKRLPKGKLIILSATANEEIYRRLFPERSVVAYSCKKAAYLGKVVQYTDCSYSRFALEHEPERKDRMLKLVGKKPVITFRSVEQFFETTYHFGNVEGINCLAGKDLAVIGLPNVAEEIYGLFGMLAGAEMKRKKMRPQRIQHNGYSFYLNTYDDLVLREIQSWMISSQLEQAVGRARLLRNDCTVMVFSGFPVEQGEIVRGKV